jgi:hypothetical protein
MDIWDLISSTGEGGADQSWWDTFNFDDIDYGEWSKVLSDLPDSWWTSIGVDPTDITSVGGSGSSYGTGEGLPGEEAAAGSQGGSGGTGNVLTGVGGSGSSYGTGVGAPGEEAAAGSQGGSGGTGNILPKDNVTNILKKIFVNDDGGINPLGILGATALLPKLFGDSKSSTPAPSGYQGGVPKYTAVRERVAGTTDPERRPGSGGRRYFSDISYAPKTGVAADAEKDAAALAAAKTAAQEQAAGLATLNTSNPAYEKRPASVLPPKTTDTTKPVTTPPLAASGVAQLLPVMEPKLIEQYMADKAFVGPRQQTEPASAVPDLSIPITAARGGLMNLARGRYLNGSSDGMADKIPATIEDKQPARLSHGEFVVPADVVSHLGNGNSEAGAQRLYSMMDKIRKARTGTTKQGKQINPNKYLPA